VAALHDMQRDAIDMNTGTARHSAGNNVIRSIASLNALGPATVDSLPQKFEPGPFNYFIGFDLPD
jgi:hypothetical protein